jgi:hypothetical protein
MRLAVVVIAQAPSPGTTMATNAALGTPTSAPAGRASMMWEEKHGAALYLHEDFTRRDEKPLKMFSPPTRTKRTNQS